MHPRRTLLALRLMQTKASAEPMKGAARHSSTSVDTLDTGALPHGVEHSSSCTSSRAELTSSRSRARRTATVSPALEPAAGTNIGGGTCEHIPR